MLLSGYSSCIFSKVQGVWKVVGRLTGKHMDALSADNIRRELDTLDFSAKPNTWRDLWVGDMKYQVEEQ